MSVLHIVADAILAVPVRSTFRPLRFRISALERLKGCPANLWGVDVAAAQMAGNDHTVESLRQTGILGMIFRPREHNSAEELRCIALSFEQGDFFGGLSRVPVEKSREWSEPDKQAPA